VNPLHPEDRHAPVISYVAGILALTVAVSQAAGLNPFGRVGLPLTRQDFKEMAEAESPLLNDETIPLGTSRGGANASSGNSGVIILIDRFATNFQGTKLPCLKLRYHVVIRNRSDPYNLLLDRCQVADSRWKLASNGACAENDPARQSAHTTRSACHSWNLGCRLPNSGAVGDNRGRDTSCGLACGRQGNRGAAA